jgi:hypothetical protein
MRLFGGKHTKERQSTAVIFDIGSGSVGAALVQIEADQNLKPRLLYNTRIPISYQHIPNFETLTKSMLATLLDITLCLQTEGIPLLQDNNAHKKDQAVDYVLFTFASPWCATQAKVFTISNKRPFEVTHNMVDELVEKEIKAFDSSRKETIEGDDKLILIDKQIIHSTLNGYSTASPYGRTARKADFHLVLSVIPKNVYDKTGEVVNQLLNGRAGNYNTFAITSFTAIRDIAHDTESFVLVDIGAEVTDISSVHKSALKNLGSFPQGKHFVYRRLSKKLGATPAEIPSILKSFFNETSDTKQTLKISAVLAEIGEEWVALFEKTLKEVYENTPLPPHLFLTTDNDLIEWFTDVLKRKHFSELILSNGIFSVTQIDGDFLKDHINAEKKVASTDPFLGIETLFLKRVLHEAL